MQILEDEAYAMYAQAKMLTTIDSLLENQIDLTRDQTPSQLIDVYVAVVKRAFGPYMNVFPYFQVTKTPNTTISTDGITFKAVASKSQQIYIPSNKKSEQSMTTLVVELQNIINQVLDNGDVFVSYIPLIFRVVYDPYTFRPNYSVVTRYGVCPK